MIKLDKVSKSYDALRVLDDVSLTLAQGCTTAVMGLSGSGKSTLLALIVGLEAPDQGEVRIGDDRMAPASALNLRRRMGYVIQDGGLFPHLTARRNIELMSRELGWRAARRSKRLQELCTLTRFPAEALERYPAELSGGQRQRVSLMRALMLDPPILLLDEPLGALDPMTRARLQEDLKSIFRTLKKTVVIVTHDVSEAAFLGDTIVFLHQGRVLQQGSFRDLIAAPADPFITEFIRAQASRLATLREIASTLREPAP
ncbi:ATP-binding cassette domain-containing protein [Methylocystis bryophila]|uniref:ABC transporter ATP-binding protein n=1 Tax=Methylocystis bryophila TaxID=655015 RepID=A0A1W6MXB8_9HYPH|nr:ATP-binding cassette domain-containing protein [Methylocystis bryophila]ARN82238.1 ABC transporter ATP-binding protein [Methylocystis bryophila]BDV38377.1 ABC transporter ATP-binding protein [Methylocystis bryophila]